VKSKSRPVARKKYGRPSKLESLGPGSRFKKNQSIPREYLESLYKVNPEPPEPTDAVPGSLEKIKVLAERAANRQVLHVDGDRKTYT